MKISKKRLLEIIQEECGMPMGSYEMNPKGNIDREGRMAKRQLSHIAEYAHDLSQMLEDETQLEAWVQSKLTKAADYITPEMQEMSPVGVEMPMNESKDDDTYEF